MDKSQPCRLAIVMSLLLAGCVERQADDQPASVTADRVSADSAQHDVSPTAAPLDAWTQAAQAIRVIPLDSFPEIPQWARVEFAEHGCAVAQAFYPSPLHNVISGEFARTGQGDWAILCGVSSETHIVVAWGGSARCHGSLAVAPNQDYLQGIGDEQIGFSRLLGAVSNEAIQRLAEEFEGPAPPSTDHDGINDMFVEKASVIHYCHDGGWRTLAGVD